MKRFIQKHAKDVIGVLSGFDRLVLRGTLRGLIFPEGVKGYLWRERVLLKDFKKHALMVTERVREAASRVALAEGRPNEYLHSPKDDKEAIARAIAERDRVLAGHVATLRCVEPCIAISVRPNKATGKLEPYLGDRFCLHCYHYPGCPRDKIPLTFRPSVGGDPKRAVLPPRHVNGIVGDVGGKEDLLHG